MIERNILKQKIKEYRIKDLLETELFGAGFSKADIKRTPLGEKIIVSTSRPGMVVGRSGKNIKDLTESLKTKFTLDNPQIEINEIKKTSLDANLMAEKIAISLQRFGSNRFKNIIHKAAEEIMNAGAKGVEILLSGKVPSARARRWRINQGNLKKCGEPALIYVDIAYKVAKIKAGVVGIIVKIMPPNMVLPDYVSIHVEEETPEEDNDNKEKKASDKKTVDVEVKKDEKLSKKENKTETKEASKVSEKEVKTDAKVEVKEDVKKEIKADAKEVNENKEINVDVKVKKDEELSKKENKEASKVSEKEVKTDAKVEVNETEVKETKKVKDTIVKGSDDSE